MFCKECGTEFQDGVFYCRNCGCRLRNSDGDYDSSNKTIPNEEIEKDSHDDINIKEQIEIAKEHKIFYDDKEILVDSIGSGYFSSLLSQKQIMKSVLFCSNKRVYQRGIIFEEKKNGIIIYRHGEKSVDIREITAVSFQVDRPINWLVTVFISVGILAIIIGILSKLDSGIDFGDFVIALLAPLLLIGGALIVSWFKKAKWFTIEYAGGKMITNCNWYRTSSLRRFMKSVSKQKDCLLEDRAIAK